ncbi:PAAR domain-containing protein [Epibacterium ulvae]|uniref:PAAR domain-containing protein n=1 Tax=Epibacterium ulvae TaxID=1156985 RepID=UPI001BFC3756|nr:PAAR domain-containing protein [Epibacterium ulvae]MBT8155476.1 PAAR domain-containing protein [Epibacterium ulvae]
MTMPQARVADLHACMLPSTPPPPVLPVPTPILPPCAVQVLVGKMPAARMTDMCTAVPPHPIIKGSGTVLIQKLPAARMMDQAACGGMIVKGEFTVLVGG